MKEIKNLLKVKSIVTLIIMVVFVFSAIEYITFKITNMLKEEKKVKKENNKKKEIPKNKFNKKIRIR